MIKKNTPKKNNNTHAEIEQSASQIITFTSAWKGYVVPGGMFAISLIVNLIVLADYLKSPFAQVPVWDANVYWKWAHQIAAGNWIGSTIFHQAPLYPYFISFFVMVCGKVLWPIYICQSILSAFSTLLIYSITKKISGNNMTGIIAGLLYAFYGMQVFYTTKLLSESLSIFLLLLISQLLIADTFTKKRLVSAGIAMGLLLIAKPHFIIAVPLVLAYLIRMDVQKKLIRHFSIASQFIFPIVIIVGSVAIRNYVVGKDFVLISSNGGENFYIGNNEKVEGTYKPVKGISQDIEFQNEDINEIAQQKTGQNMTRSEVSKYWFNQGIKFILHHPKEYFWLEIQKMKFIFSGAERSTMYYLEFEKLQLTKSLSIPFINFYVLLPLCVAGFLMALFQFVRTK